MVKPRVLAAEARLRDGHDAGERLSSVAVNSRLTNGAAQPNSPTPFGPSAARNDTKTSTDIAPHRRPPALALGLLSTPRASASAMATWPTARRPPHGFATGVVVRCLNPPSSPRQPAFSALPMPPQELKSVLQAGLLSFALTDFDSELRFAPKPYAERLEWLQPYGASAPVCSRWHRRVLLTGAAGIWRRGASGR